MVWRSEYAPATKHGQSGCNGRRSDAKRKMRRRHAKMARADAKRQIVDATAEAKESSCAAWLTC
jgi:hypothetical protein